MKPTVRKNKQTKKPQQLFTPRIIPVTKCTKRLNDTQGLLPPVIK